MFCANSTRAAKLLLCIRQWHGVVQQQNVNLSISFFYFSMLDYRKGSVCFGWGRHNPQRFQSGAWSDWVDGSGRLEFGLAGSSTNNCEAQLSGGRQQLLFFYSHIIIWTPERSESSSLAIRNTSETNSQNCIITRRSGFTAPEHQSSPRCMLHAWTMQTKYFEKTKPFFLGMEPLLFTASTECRKGCVAV